MNDVLLLSSAFGVVISLVGYGIGMLARAKVHKGLCNPLLISILFVIASLKLAGISYETYNFSAKYLSYLLTPATVSLAIPLYLQLEKLKRNFTAILVGVLSGVIASMGSVAAMAALFGLSHKEYVTLLPKSITTAIGMGVSEELGGYVTISVAVIIITGIIGNLIAEEFEGLNLALGVEEICIVEDVNQALVVFIAGLDTSLSLLGIVVNLPYTIGQAALDIKANQNPKMFV